MRIIWVEGLITERNDANGLAAGCDEIPPIRAVDPGGAGRRPRRACICGRLERSAGDIPDTQRQAAKVSP